MKGKGKGLRKKKKALVSPWTFDALLFLFSPVVVISSVCSTQPQGCLFSKGCCKIINVTLKDVSSTWLPSLSLPRSFFLSLPGCSPNTSSFFWLELTICPTIGSQMTTIQLFVILLPAQVSSIIFVYCEGPENKWKLPVDFHHPHPPGGASH